MSFRLHHSVTLQCSLQEAQEILLDSSNFVKLQEVLPSCSKCEILSKGISDGIPQLSPTITPQTLAQDLDSQDFPDHLPWPPLTDPQGDPHATYFKFVEMGHAEVSGSQYVSKDLGVVFFHSHVPKAGIEEWKLRLVQADGDDKTVRVTETVWGIAPRWLSWFLYLSGLAQRTHRNHVDLYSKLLPHGTKA